MLQKILFASIGLRLSRRAIRILALVLLLFLTACAMPSKPDSSRIDKATLLRAEVNTAGIRRNRNDDVTGFHMVKLTNDSTVVLESSPANWRLRTAKIVRINDGAVIREKTIPIHALNTGGADSIGAMQTFRGTRIAFGGTNGEVVLWDLPTDRIRYLSKTLGNRYVEKMEFAPDGRLFISGNGLQVWNTDSGELLFQMSGVSAFALTRDSDIVIAREDGFDEISGKTYRLRKHDPFEFPSNPDGVSGSPVDLARLPDGRILEQGYTGDIRIWNFAKRRSSDAIAPDVWIRSDVRDAHGNLSCDWSLNATYDADGYVMAESQIDDVVRVWNASDGTLLAMLKRPDESEHPNSYGSASFIPLANQRLVTLYADGKSYVWDLRGQVLLTELPISLKDVWKND